MKTNLNNIVKIDWLQRWSGSYTFISCSFWGPQYFYTLKKILGVNFRHTLFVHKKGTVSFYVKTDELHTLGKNLAKKADAKNLKKFSELIKRNTDLLVKLMGKKKGKIPSWSEYQQFAIPFANHLAYHGFIKETVDYLSPQKLKTLLPGFLKARKYSERIYSDSEVFFRALAKTIAKKEKRPANLLTCLTQKELENYLKTRRLPDNQTLGSRWQASVLYFINGRSQMLNGAQIAKLEKKIITKTNKGGNIITGISAYPGKITGIARIIPNPRHYKAFNKGDVLITGMTRPEFLPLFKLASAVVTDSGGVLSHAAITARELKKTCVVGTQVATKLLKNGQKIHVNGETGIIKSI